MSSETSHKLLRKTILGEEILDGGGGANSLNIKFTHRGSKSLMGPLGCLGGPTLRGSSARGFLSGFRLTDEESEEAALVLLQQRGNKKEGAHETKLCAHRIKLWVQNSSTGLYSQSLVATTEQCLISTHLHVIKNLYSDPLGRNFTFYLWTRLN